jgi:hypothetical protein
MEDFDLYGPQPDGQPEPAPQMMEPVPFTQADNLRLQRISAAMSDVQDKVAEGDLHPEEGDILGQQLLAQQKPLLLRQQQAKQSMKREMYQDAAEQQAMAQAIKQGNIKHDMEALPSLLQTVTDTMTGETAHYMPPGYELVPFGSQKDKPEAGKSGEINAYTPVGGGLAMGANPNPQGGDLPPAEPKLPPERPTPEGGTHTMEIWNGGRKSVGTYVNGKLVSVEGDQTAAPDGWNRQGQQQGQQGQAGQDQSLSETQIAELRRRADSSIAPLRPTGNPRIDANAYVAREAQVNSLAKDLVQGEIKRRNTAATQATSADEHKRQESVREDMQRQKEEKAKATKEGRDNDTKDLRHQVSEIQKERSIYKDTPDAMPDYLKSHDAMLAEAHRRMGVERDILSGEGKTKADAAAKIADILKKRLEQQTAQPAAGQPQAATQVDPKVAGLAQLNERRRQQGLKPLDKLPETWLDPLLRNMPAMPWQENEFAKTKK